LNVVQLMAPTYALAYKAADIILAASNPQTSSSTSTSASSSSTSSSSSGQTDSTTKPNAAVGLRLRTGMGGVVVGVVVGAVVFGAVLF